MAVDPFCPDQYLGSSSTSEVRYWYVGEFCVAGVATQGFADSATMHGERQRCAPGRCPDPITDYTVHRPNQVKTARFVVAPARLYFRKGESNPDDRRGRVDEFLCDPRWYVEERRITIPADGGTEFRLFKLFDANTGTALKYGIAWQIDPRSGPPTILHSGLPNLSLKPGIATGQLTPAGSTTPAKDFIHIDTYGDFLL